MNIEESDLDKLCKVLALTNSDKPGEALAAFQSAKRLLLAQGMSFEDIVARYFDNSGMSPQQQISGLKKQKSILKRQNADLSYELGENRKAVKDLTRQLLELQAKVEGKDEPSVVQEVPPRQYIEETFHPNLTG